MPGHQAGMMIRPPVNAPFSQDNDFLPLTEVSIEAEINEAIAHVKIIQEYVNPNRDEPQDAQDEPKGGPITITYKFPKKQDVMISKLLITVGDKTIQAKVMGEEDANEKYEDAIAGGPTAAMVSDIRENVDLHQLDIGNILPGQNARIEIQLI
jgi:hypothetical protein